MSFLAPLFLLGAAAITLPVVFHLIRRASKDHMPFSSLMFLQPEPPRLTKRSRLEHILLLLLRCLVICLLALGFARPFLQRPMSAAPMTETTRRVVILLDTSASMRRDGMWADAVAKAGAALRALAPGDQAAVFTFDNRVRPLVSFEQWAAMNQAERAAVTSGRIANVQPGWGDTHLGNALITAAESFADADKQTRANGPRRIIVITDLQEGSRLDGLQGYEWPHGIEVQVEVIPPRKPTNAGLQWIAPNEETASSVTNAAPRIRVSNSANAKREQFQVRWDGVAGAVPLEVYVPPGQNRILPAPELPDNATSQRLVLSGDDDDFDNSVYLLQPRAEHPTVIYIGDGGENDSTQSLYFLKRAFPPTIRQVIELKTHATMDTIGPADLADARLIIATGSLQADQSAPLKQAVEAGATLLFVVKDTATAADLGRIVGVDGLTAESVTAPNYAMLGMVDFEHPLFAPFADPRYNDFTRIHFWKYRKLDAGKITGARVLAKFDSGDPALLEVPRGKGRVLVLTSGWQQADSQLALSSKFVPLLYAMLDLSGGSKPPLTQVQVGEEVDLSGAAVNGQALNVQKPDGTQAQLPAGATRFNQTDLPGIYMVTTAQPPVQFAVNLDPAESRTAVLPIDQLERLGVPLQAREVSVARQVEQQRRMHDADLENRQKLWRWLTLAALVVLLGETWLAGWLTRRTAFESRAQT